MNVLKKLMTVLRAVPIVLEATPAPVALVLSYQPTVADAMVNFCGTVSVHIPYFHLPLSTIRY